MKMRYQQWLIQLALGLLILVGPTSLVLAEEEEESCDAEASEEAPPKSGCTDHHEQCEYWASIGKSKRQYLFHAIYGAGCKD